MDAKTLAAAMGYTDKQVKNVQAGGVSDSYIQEQITNNPTVASKVTMDEVNTQVNELLDENLVTKLELQSVDVITDNLYVIETSADNHYLELGKTEPTQNQYSSLWTVTDFIDVSGYDELIYSGLTNVGKAPYSAFYDSNKVLFSSFKQQVGDNKIISVPNKVKYIRLSLFIDDKSNFIIKGKSKGKFAELIANMTTSICDLNDIQLWEQGVINGWGGTISNDSPIHLKRIRTKTYIPSNVQEISISPKYKYALCCYDDSGNAYKNSSIYYTFKNSENPVENFSCDVVYTQNNTVLSEIAPYIKGYENIRLIVAEVTGNIEITPQDYSAIQLIGTNFNEMENVYLVDHSGGVIRSGVDANNPIWTQWNSRLAFGMDTSNGVIPVKVDGQMFVDGTMIVRNSANKNRNRWGFHVYEAYAKDNYSRMTMLLDKHTEFNKRCFEMYYYTGANHYAPSYSWTRIGSDVANHSFMFDRDTMIALGIIDARSIINLARISPTTDLDTSCATVEEADKKYEPDSKGVENFKCLLYLALKNAENGAMFYDTDREKPVIKVNGKWCELACTEITDGLYDEFNDTE